MGFNQSNDEADRCAQFTSLFGAYNKRIYAFVRMFIQNRADADEVFQESCSVLWAKFDQYSPGTNFWAWSCRVVRFEALRFLRKNKLRHRVFQESFYDAIESKAVQMGGILDAELDALADCYAKLNPSKRELLDQLYLPGATVKSVSIKLGRSRNAVYKSLGAIHKSLLDCIQRIMAEKGRR